MLDPDVVAITGVAGMVLHEQQQTPTDPNRADQISRIVVLCTCAATVILALLALIGWSTHRLSLTSYGAAYVPMAPATAILFVLAGFFLPCSKARIMLWLRSVIFTAIGAVAVSELIGPGTLLPFTLDSLLIPQPGSFGSVVIARMSPLTSVVFLLVSVSRVVFPPRRKPADIPAILGLAPAAVGFTVFLGYLYGRPLLSTGTVVPVALSTGIAFFLLGIALIAEPGIRSFPTRLLIGGSTRARLFRILLPLAPVTIIVDALLVDVLPLSNPAIRTSLFGILMVVTATAAILSATHSIGGSIDRALDVLTAQEGELRAIFNGTMDAMLIAETEGSVLDANPAACYLFGVPLESLRGATFFSLGLMGEHSTEVWSRFLRLGRLSGSSRLSLPDDTLLEIEYSMTANILPRRHLIVLRDVTESRMQMLESERLAAIVGSTSDAIYSKDVDGRIVSWNAAAQDIFGYTEEEVLGRNEERLYPDGRFVGTGRTLSGTEVEALRKDGRRLVVSISESAILDPAGAKVGTSVIARDVTAHRDAERELAETAARLRAFFDSRAVGILFGNVDGSVVDANDLFLEMIGYTRHELQSQSIRWTNITPPVFLPLDENAIQEAQRFGACRPYEKQYIRKDGTPFWVLVGFVLLEPDRRDSIAFIIDIDEKKRTEQALHRSEERFGRMFHASPVAVGISDFETARIIDVNGQWLDFYGYDRNEVLGRSAMDLELWVNPHDREELMTRIEGGAPVAQMETDMRRKDGELRQAVISMTSSSLSSEQTRVMIVTIVDTTEIRELQRQLIQSQKMEAVGRLAGGVAHDFNNMLGVIIGFAELVEKNIRKEDSHKIEQVIAAAKRAAALTNQLLAFSRKQLLEPKVVNLNELVAGLAAMLGRLIGEDIRLETDLDPELGQVNADPGQLEQVVMNFAVNSRDAMPEGGVLRIATSNAELDESFALPDEPIVPGAYVMLSVTDTGTGMDEETVSHLFEPFFTTKEQGKGTGLGLSTAYGIIKQSAGYIWVYSRPGKGTTFKIFLPRKDAPAVMREPKISPEEKSGSETILLVEDEPTLRAMITELLSTRGYSVMTAEDGDEALTHYAEDPLHLLISDVVMPGMSGVELARKLAERRPELKVLFISGYTADTAELEELLATNARLLPKPFSNSALLDRVRELLDNPN